MRKLLLTVLVLLLMASTSYAVVDVSELVDKLPSMKSGIAYSIVDKNINYLSTATIAKWKMLSLEAGIAGSPGVENTGTKLVGVLSYDLLSLDKWVDFPILKEVGFQPGIWFGAGPITGSFETDWGISVTLIEVKF